MTKRKNDLKKILETLLYLVYLTAQQTNMAAPKNLSELLSEVLIAAAEPESGDRANVLLAVLRKHRFWPALQMKKFFDKSGLVLLHNTYKRKDVDDFRELYDECRSVVLDLSAPEGENVVVSLAHAIPETMTIDTFRYGEKDNCDACEIGYEGTVVYVYEHKGKWYFGTSGCPTIDSSRYFHPTKTHGEMLNDIISDREAFCAKLDAGKTYSFILVHHQNRHIMDYSTEFGAADYGKLVHIGTRDRLTMEEDDITTHPLAHIDGIIYARRFASPEEAIEEIDRASDGVYCLIAKSSTGLYKVTFPHIIKREEFDLGNPNKWHNILHVYMQNNREYQINDYIDEYALDIVIPKNSSGRDMAPTYIVHTVVCTMRDILYDLYVRTTTYNPSIGRFRMNKEADAALPPILRFHIAQLRRLQTSAAHSHAFITPKVVYQYLCFNQTMKNMRVLINFFATNGGYGMNFRQAECFGVLNQLLQE